MAATARSVHRNGHYSDHSGAHLPGGKDEPGQARQLRDPSVHEPLPADVSTIRPVAGSPSSVAPPTVPICVPEASPTSPSGASTSTTPFWPGVKLPVTVLTGLYW